MKIAYDFDGTIIQSPIRNVFIKKIIFKMNPKINKDNVINIITARTPIWKGITWLSCRLLGLKNLNTIIFNPCSTWNIDYISSWKYSVLVAHGFDAYVDSDYQILDNIRDLGFKGELICL